MTRTNMDHSILDIALSCLKKLEEIEVERTNIPMLHSHITYVDYDVKATKTDLEAILGELRITLREELPSIAGILDRLIYSFNNAEAAQKLSSIKTLVETVIAISKNNNTVSKRRVFISHSSKDRTVVTEFVDQILMLGIGLRSEDIFCTSIEDMTMANGEDIRTHIRENIRTADYSFLLISDNYKRSEICLNEMGAVWATDNDVKYCLLPGISFESLGWLVSPKKAHYITDRTFLDSLKNEITSRYNIDNGRVSWSMHREVFVELMNKQ